MPVCGLRQNFQSINHEDLAEERVTLGGPFGREMSAVAIVTAGFGIRLRDAHRDAWLLPPVLAFKSVQRTPPADDHQEVALLQDQFWFRFQCLFLLAFTRSQHKNDVQVMIRP